MNKQNPTGISHDVSAIVRNALQNSGFPLVQHREPTLPQLIWIKIEKFVLPKEAISLKLLFDNVRNYMICAAVVAAAAASTGNTKWPWPLTIFALFLVVTNLLQSWFIIQRISFQIDQFIKEDGTSSGIFRKLIMKAFQTILLILVIAAAFEGFSSLLIWVAHGGNSRG